MLWLVLGFIVLPLLMPWLSEQVFPTRRLPPISPEEARAAEQRRRENDIVWNFVWAILALLFVAFLLFLIFTQQTDHSPGGSPDRFNPNF